MTPSPLQSGQVFICAPLMSGASSGPGHRRGLGGFDGDGPGPGTTGSLRLSSTACAYLGNETARKSFRFLSCSPAWPPLQQLRQLGDVGCDPASFIFAEQLGRRSPAWFVLIIDVAQRLPVSVTHDKAGGLFFDRPRRREAVAGGLMSYGSNFLNAARELGVYVGRAFSRYA